MFINKLVRHTANTESLQYWQGTGVLFRFADTFYLTDFTRYQNNVIYRAPLCRERIRAAHEELANRLMTRAIV